MSTLAEGPWLALDVGDRRIGTATASPAGRLPIPGVVLQRRNRASDTAAIVALAATCGAASLVVGLPLGLDNEPTEQAHRIVPFARRVAAAAGLTLVYIDESGSSREAVQRAPRGEVDAVAAAIILERYLAGAPAIDPPAML